MSLKSAVLTGLVGFSSLISNAQTGSDGQILQNKSPPATQITAYNQAVRRTQFLQNTEFLLLLKSYHTDRKTPFNELNTGLIVATHVNANVTHLRGVYRNSNYDVSPTCSGMSEGSINLGLNGNLQLRYGVVIGFAGYRKKKKNTCETREIILWPGDSLPDPVRMRGKQITYTRGGDGKCYETISTRNARGNGLMHPRFIIFPTASLTYKGNGAFIMAAVAPDLGTYGGVGAVFATGIRLNPGALLQPKPQPAPGIKPN